MKTDPCPCLVKYSLDVLKKKTKVLDIFNTDKKCLMKINIELSPPESWIRIIIIWYFISAIKKINHTTKVSQFFFFEKNHFKNVYKKREGC